MYNVEELPDTEMPIPPSFPRLQRPLRDQVTEEDIDQVFFHHHDQVIRGLSQVSCIPYMALKSVWPWRLVGLIRTALDQHPVFDGLRKNLPPLVASSVGSQDDSTQSSSLLEPTAFSFWMASNMSLKDDQKLVLLRMPGTVERLRFILNKVLEQGSTRMNVCCKGCHAVLSSASHIFTVGGAEGTTGAYGEQSVVCNGRFPMRYQLTCFPS